MTMAQATVSRQSVTKRVSGSDAGHRGPSLQILAVVHMVLFGTSFLALNVLSDAAWPLPGSSLATIAHYIRSNDLVVRIGGAAQVAAAVPLAIFAATVSSQLTHLRVRAAGPTIALVGGALGSVFLALSGLGIAAMATIGDLTSSATLVVVHQLVFLAGGPAMIVMTGLLVAGTAVPSRIFGFLPRWSANLGIAIAVLSEFTTLAVAFEQATFLLPLARVGGVTWLLFAAVMLPKGGRRAWREK